MPRTTPSRMRRLRAIVSPSTASGAKAPPWVAVCLGGLKPAPPNFADVDSCWALGNLSEVGDDPLEASGDSLEASAGFVGRGFSRDIASGQIEGALAPEAPALIGPNRSESSTAIGRAPIVKMSRRIPPTPVAAPWNGST